MIALAGLRTRTMSAFGYHEPDVENVVPANGSLADAIVEALGCFGYGVLVVDACAHIWLTNAKTRDLFRSRRLVVSGGRLCAPGGSDTATLHQWIAQGAQTNLNHAELREPAACQIGDLLLQFAPLAVRPVGEILIGKRLLAVLVVDPVSHANPTPTQLRLRFGLTAAEAIFACEIISGDGLMQCARRLGITEATARTHMHRIFEKTGTKRQAQLVRALLGPQMQTIR